MKNSNLNMFCRWKNKWEENVDTTLQFACSDNFMIKKSERLSLVLTAGKTAEGSS